MGKLVMCFGSFDLLHQGHKFFINQCLSYGEKLIIVLARDLNIIKQKNHQPLFLEQERLKILQNNFPHCEVVLGDEYDFLQVIKKYKPDIICLGYDQTTDELAIKKIIPLVKIVRILALKPEKYKSSLLKNEGKQ